MVNTDGQRLASLVRTGGVLVLTGAGLSTDSGIPDYRGRDGIRRVMPMQFAEFTASAQARQRYWARGFLGWRRFAGAQPNRGHRAVAHLERLGLVDAVVTQNVDGLHAAAGSDRVVELHGSLGHVVCLTCGDRTPREAVQERMATANPSFEQHLSAVLADGSQVSSQIRPDGDIVLADEAVGAFRPPTCLVCSGTTLKPDVVFFGESVPKATVQHCLDLVDAAGSLLVLGSSLAVMSGYRLVRRAASHGIPVAIVTHGPTRGDPQASVRLDASLTPTLTALVTDVAGARCDAGLP
ncbi:MAG: Sir2 family NAD-dependent protein deacetylase [Dermatophilaceae bacterium]